MTEAERAIVKAMLIKAGHTEHDAGWMSASCPSMQRAREICQQDRRRTIMRRHTPSPEAVRIREAHAAMKQAMGTPQETAARATLQAAVDAAYAKAVRT